MATEHLSDYEEPRDGLLTGDWIWIMNQTDEEGEVIKTIFLCPE